MKHTARKVLFLILIVIIAISIYHYTNPVITPKPTEFVPLYYEIGNPEIGEPITYIRNEDA